MAFGMSGRAWCNSYSTSMLDGALDMTCIMNQPKKVTHGAPLTRTAVGPFFGIEWVFDIQWILLSCIGK